MKVVEIQKFLKIIIDLKFAMLILALIALTSSLGSFIEQDEPITFYENTYLQPIYGFIDSKFILKVGLDHVYTTWWFLALLILLSISLIGCTISRQFPLFKNSKEYFFKKQNNSFLLLPFSIKIKNIYYLKENIITKIQNLNFYIYQKDNVIYGYRGLIGRLSPILVHLSLLLILLGTSIGAFENFKAQEILPKGEIFHIQNPLRVGWITNVPQVNTRVNDFWVEYENNRIHQFYSNISILDGFGNEIKEQTISVNNPLRYDTIDFYQSDWNLIGIRFEDFQQKKIYESPVFPLENGSKSWITWINTSQNNFTLVFDQLQDTFLIYEKTGEFLGLKNIGELVNSNLSILDLLPSTGLQIKYDPSISIIYFGFGLLIITACLSYFPYTQIWVLNQSTHSWLGSSTNRGKIQLEIEFENLIRSIERSLSKNIFLSKN